MIPVRIEARLQGAICLPAGPIALDALLIYATALRNGLPPPATAKDCLPLPIPIEQRDGIYLASVGAFEVELRESSFTNRRFPLPEAQMMAGPRFKRIEVSAGPSKSYRLPREHLHLIEDRITWWAIGDVASTLELLTDHIHYLGKRRAVGLGRVQAWSVEPCEPWGTGFPVLRDGQPTRTLPATWPGLAHGVETAFAVSTPPYWDNTRRELCAVPQWS
ncbi:MAG: hypothetical protein NVS3B20_08760 [Polyangiales bacterium]